MGKDSGIEDRYYGECPFSVVKVKNTFIDVGVDECDFEDVGSLVGRVKSRQVSEPAPRIARQLSERPVYSGSLVGHAEDEEEPESEPVRPVADEPKTAATEVALGEARAAPPAAIASKGLAAADATVPAQWANTFTVMMRNLPNKYTQQGLIQEIGEAGFSGAFDFFYLPIDPETGANRGYVFINFIEPSYAWAFRNAYEGEKMSSSSKSRKVVTVTPAALQGFDANYAHYNSARCFRGGDASARPLFLRTPIEDSDASAKVGRRRRRGGGRSAIDLAVRRQKMAQEQKDVVEERRLPGHEQQLMQQQAAKVAAPQAQAAAQPGHPEVRFCYSCGAEVRQHFQFCSCCGVLVGHAGNPSIAAAAQEQEKPHLGSPADSMYYLVSPQGDLASPTVSAFGLQGAGLA